jgi:hypothetical protein
MEVWQAAALDAACRAVRPRGRRRGTPDEILETALAFSPMCRRHDSRPGLHDDAFHPLLGTRGPRWGTPARRTHMHRTGPSARDHYAGRTESNSRKNGDMCPPERCGPPAVTFADRLRDGHAMQGSSISAVRIERTAHPVPSDDVSADQRHCVVRDRIELSTFRFSGQPR